MERSWGSSQTWGSGAKSRRGLGLRLRWFAAVATVAAALSFAGVASAAAPAGSGTPAPHALGLLSVRQARPSAAAIARVRAAATSLPASVDLTANAMPVGNQGQVGSCAAWATVYGALGYWERAEQLSGGALAPMYTYSQYVSAYDGGHDGGSTIDYHLQVAKQQGVDNQADYFQGNFDYSDVPTSAERYNAVNWKLSGYADLPVQQSASSAVTQQSIEGALAAGNPVVIGIPVYSTFEIVTSANSGYYAGPIGNDSLLGNHGIVALGYNAQGLVIENSWGTSWGNAGYATLAWPFVNEYVFQATSVGRLLTGQPLNTAAPTVSGAAGVGGTLSASTGSWNPSASSYAYQWERAVAGSNAWAVIAGATGGTYTPVSADVNYNVRVLVIAANGVGQGAASSAGVGPVTGGGAAPANTVAPAITGIPVQGQRLAVSTGTWNPAGSSYAYQWQRAAGAASGWTNISGATTAGYTPGTADVIATLRVLVTASNSYGQATAASAPVGPVASGAPINRVPPVVAGTPIRGSQLSATTGTWTNPGPAFVYQWQRSVGAANRWANIAGASAASYKPVAADVGAQLRVQVTTSNQWGAASALSAATAKVLGAPPLNLTPLVTSGVPRSGNVLSASTGTWSGVGNTYTYLWQRNVGGGFVTIAGAVASTYRVASADQRAQLRVVVTAANSDGTASKASNATAVLSARRRVLGSR